MVHRVALKDEVEEGPSLKIRSENGGGGKLFLASRRDVLKCARRESRAVYVMSSVGRRDSRDRNNHDGDQEYVEGLAVACR